MGDNSTPLAFNNILGTVPPAQGTIPNNLTSLWVWNSASANWYFYAPSLDSLGTLAAYITSKSYLNFATNGTTLAPSTGFWVNRPASAGAPAPIVVVPANPTLAGIQAAMASFQSLFATAIPLATDPAFVALFDATTLNGGANKAAFLTQLVTPANGPSVGAQFNNITLVTSLDSTAVPNDATHQWFTFNVTPGGGPTSAWLAIKNVAGTWLLAGDQRQFGTNTTSQAVQIIPSASQIGVPVAYQNQMSFGVGGGNTPVPAAITKITLSGPGLIPVAGATEVPLYTPATGQIWISACGAPATVLSNCVNMAQVSVGAPYVYHVYTGGVTQAYSYTDALVRGPLSASALIAANFPVITSVAGNWASGSTVSAGWTLPAGITANWLSAGASTSTGLSLFQTGSGLTPASTTGAIVVPAYTGTSASNYLWLQTNDAAGNQYGVSLNLDPGQVINAPLTGLTAVNNFYAAASSVSGLRRWWQDSPALSDVSADIIRLAPGATANTYIASFASQSFRNGVWGAAAPGNLTYTLEATGWLLDSRNFTILNNNDGTLTISGSANGTATATIQESVLDGTAILNQSTGMASGVTYPVGSRSYAGVGAISSKDSYKLWEGGPNNVWGVTDLNGVALTTLPAFGSSFCANGVVFTPPVNAVVSPDNYSVFGTMGGCTAASITAGLANPAIGSAMLGTMATGNAVVPVVGVAVFNQSWLPGWTDSIIGVVGGLAMSGIFDPVGTLLPAVMQSSNKIAMDAELLANGHIVLP